MKPSHRIIAAVAAGIAAFFLQPVHMWSSGEIRIVVSWDAGAIIYLAFAWFIVARADRTLTRTHTQSQDQSGYVIFLFVVAASCASIVAIIFMLHAIKGVAIALSIVALVSSWLLIHTLFAFHYARRYYAPDKRKQAHSGGLNFPGGRGPDYLDFVYYSFVVGMTSQVSDVSVTSRSMRRLTTVHSVLAFFFNIVILAMNVNIIASILS
ncbi:MAG TPA: DUF1345 domain-containing protein [Burkholderiales bacterium]|nr:DUF1345 domain-containing protein [Burkholderiales bacterium]